MPHSPNELVYHARGGDKLLLLPDVLTLGCMTGSINNDLDLSTQLQEFSTTISVLAAWIGCTVSDQFVKRLGIRKTLLVLNLGFIVGAVLTFIPNLPVFLVGRFVVGFCVGTASTTVPVLLAEISPDAIRGTITTLHQLQITVGIMVPPLAGWYLVGQVEQGWRYVMLLQGVPALMQLVCAKYVPESPRWLLRNVSEEAAEKQVRLPACLLCTCADRAHSVFCVVVAAEQIRVLRGHITQQEMEETLASFRQENARYANDAATQRQAWICPRLTCHLICHTRTPCSGESKSVSWKEVFSAKRGMTIGLGLM